MSDAVGAVIGGRYALGELLGVGGTGSVFAATDLGPDAAAVDGGPESPGDGVAPPPVAERPSSRPFGPRSGTGGGEIAPDAPPPVAERAPEARDEAGFPGGLRARARARETRVAVKLLHPHLCDDAASREAFLREARHAMRLQHPNIVRVHGAGLHDAAGVVMPWIALDLLHGPTLAEWVREAGPLPVADACAVADGILSALAAAHAAGIVHRDISPKNVMLEGADPRGAPLTADAVRIVDFGLADVAGRSTRGDGVLLTESVHRDAARGVVGNAQFMSPEQAQGLPVGPAGDVYQAGAVLYFALTGAVPYPRPSTEAVLAAHVSAPPPVPSALAPGAHPLDTVATRAMAKSPGARYRDAAEFRAALTAAIERAGITPPGGDEARDLPDDRAPIEAGAVTRILPASGAAVANDAVESTDAAPTSELSPAEWRGARRSSRTGVAAASVAAVILAAAVWGVVATTADSGRSDAAPAPSASAAPEPTDEPPAPEPTETPPASPPPEPEPEVEPEAPEPPPVTHVPVPTLFGTLRDAEAALRGAGLVLGTVTRVDSAEPADRVLAHHPVAGEQVAPGSVVDVTIASGTNAVPHVSGMTLAAATAMLQSAGFSAASDRPGASSTVPVTGTQPPAGTVLRVGVTVTIVVDASTPTPHPTPTGEGAR